MLLLLYGCQAQAQSQSRSQSELSGVSVELADVDTDWKFRGDVREAKSSRISLQIEDKTDGGLSVGCGIGYFSTRVAADNRDDTNRYDGEYLELYLRKPVRITDSIALHSLFNFRYNTGDDGEGEDRVDIQWNESRVEFGLSFLFSSLRLTPYAAYYDIDGDTDGENGTDVFEVDDPQSQGIRFDYFVDTTAFIRLQIQSGNDSGGLITFARRY